MHYESTILAIEGEKSDDLRGWNQGIDTKRRLRRQILRTRSVPGEHAFMYCISQY